MKLMLGSAQFGVDYGISNEHGKTPPVEVERILNTCIEGGIEFIDTARLYGDSEQVLGSLVPEGLFNIVTKTEHLVDQECIPDICKDFNESLRNLRRDNIYGLLFHNADTLLSDYGRDLYDQAKSLKEQGKVDKIGVSVYSPEQAESILNRYEIDLIQAPLNVLDQRLLSSGLLKSLKASNVEVHCRSAFLQGVLLMNPETLPAYFSSIVPVLRKWHADVERSGGTVISAALSFLKNIEGVDRIIVGVNNSVQLLELIDAYKESINLDFTEYSLSDERFLNPSQWRFE